MKTLIHLGEKPILLISKDFDEEIDLDQLTSIDYSNLYGEAVTVSALLNKVGMLKALAEKHYNESKLDCDIFEAQYKKDLRSEARTSGGTFVIDSIEIKLTEKSLEEAVLCNPLYKKKRKEIIESKKDLDLLDSLFWAISSKDKKLNNIVKSVTPEEFFSQLVEGKVNTITIKKM